MTDLREAAQMALEALELHGQQYPHMVKGYTLDAAEALRAALAQPEQEQMMRDLSVYGTAISKGGERIDPSSIYKQTEQEPVAWVYQHEDTGLTMCVLVQQVESRFEENNPRWQKIAPLYTVPPQREWQGLTDEELRSMCKQTWVFDTIKQWAKIIEAKLREKNA